MELFNDIELTEEELKQALYAAKKEKHFQLSRQAYREKMCEERTFPTLNADQLKAFVIQKGNERFGKIQIDQDNEHIFNLLCLYFSGDKRFEALGDTFSLSKGILLFGDVGCGKTALMQLFMDNSFRSFAVLNCSNIANEYQKDGLSVLDRYCNEFQSSRPDLTFGQKFIGICFDDMGTEDQKKSFGNTTNVIGEILFSRHANAYKLSGQTHATTNLTGNRISEIYGDRLRSRMREMFNVISFPSGSKDRRK